MNILRYMLVFIPLAAIAEFAFHDMTMLVFILSAVALVPLAALMGEATEELAIHTGPKIGGLIQATLGNAAELIIAIVALSAGNIELVKASLTGSIIGNLLLVLGLSFLVGGLRHGKQSFDRELMGTSASMMMLAAIGLIVPTLFELLKEVSNPNIPLEIFNTETHDPQLNIISTGVALILIVTYALNMLHLFSSDGEETRSHTGASGTQHVVEHQTKWSVLTAVGILVVVTLAIVFVSDWLVGVVEPVAKSLGVRQLFLGVILIPIVGNVAENAVAVKAAAQNNLDLTLSVSLGASTQIALFVVPLLVLIGLLLGQKMTLFFSLFEVAVLTLSVLLATIISTRGDSNWLQGSMLLAVWLIAGLGFFFIE